MEIERSPKRRRAGFPGSLIAAVDVRTGARRLRGIVIANGSPPDGPGPAPPTVAAFIWGGKVRPTPDLPFGRFRGAA